MAMSMSIAIEMAIIMAIMFTWSEDSHLLSASVIVNVNCGNKGYNVNGNGNDAGNYHGNYCGNNVYLE